MAVELKSGDSTDLQTVDPTSKAARVTQYDSAGNEITINDPTPVTIVVNPVTVVNNDIVASFDVSTYKFLSLQLTGTWVGTVTFQGSNDNGTFDDVVSQDMGEQTSPYSESTTTTGIYKIPTAFNFLRVRVTAYTSGTVDGIALAYAEDSNTGQISATGAVSLNTGANVIGSIDNLAKMGGTAISMGSGAVDAGTQRVVLAPATDPLQTDFYVTGVGAVDVNSRMIRTGACNLIAAIFTSYAATPRHIKLYDTATAPVAGVGTPVLVLSRASVGNNAYPLPDGGFPFVNGIGMTFVQGAANSDATGTATVDGSLTSLFT